MSVARSIVKTVSLDSDLAAWVEAQAAAENRTTSNFVSTVLKKIRAAERESLRPRALEEAGNESTMTKKGTVPNPFTREGDLL